jgi:hypothetical protein
MYHLWANGFDATRGASNLVHVRGASKEFMREVLYLPLFPTAREDDWRRMARVIRAFEDQARLTDS